MAVHCVGEGGKVQLLWPGGVGKGCRFDGNFPGTDHLDVSRGIGSDCEQEGEFVVEAGFGGVPEHAQPVPLGQQAREERRKRASRSLDGKVCQGQ